MTPWDVAGYLFAVVVPSLLVVVVFRTARTSMQRWGRG